MDFMEREPMSKTLGGSSEHASGLTLREDISDIYQSYQRQRSGYDSRQNRNDQSQTGLSSDWFIIPNRRKHLHRRKILDAQDD